MAYAQDTIISANAANVFATKLTDLLVDAGWTLVEALTPSGTFSPNTKVYLSPAADNECGYDWYLAVMWKGTGTEAQVQIIAGGAYNIGTHTISQIPAFMGPSTQSGGVAYAETLTGDMFGGYNVNVAMNTTTTMANPRGGASIAKPWFAVIIPSSAFGYWMSVTLDHVFVQTTVPGTFFASSLDLDPDWITRSATLGNGGAMNPVVSFWKNDASAGPRGVSALVIGVTGSPSTTNQLAPSGRFANPAGSLLPALSNDYSPAYAWRNALYLSTINYDSRSAGGNEVYAPTTFGDGLHIGDGIDYYMVYGGSIGDTVEIDGATYVLSGLVSGTASDSSNTNRDGIYIACLVE